MAGLAHRVHDSSPLKEKFNKLVAEDETLKENHQALSCCVPTHWNSDLECLLSSRTYALQRYC